LESHHHLPRLALIGVGYIGGSVVLAARRAGLVSQTIGYDPQPWATLAAQERGVLDAIAANPEEAVRDASLVLLAAPVQSLGALLPKIAPTLRPDAIVMDVGSVKSSLVNSAETALPMGQFVGCHPMAGAEFSGVNAANAEIFPGRCCFICPARNSTPRAIASAHSFWRGIGCQTLAIDPEVHDRLMAAQSHLPHVAAYALAAALAPSLAFMEATPTPASPTTSLRDTTRIASSGPAVWRDILIANARYLIPLIEELEKCVAEIKTAVVSGQGEALERILTNGQACRQRLVKE
jgi:prephenate dehydrogenase